MRFILGVIVASVALFMWGFVFWGLSPYPATVLKPMPNRDVVANVLKESITENGVYKLPEMGDPADENWVQRMEAGPIVTVMYHGGGANPGDSTVMVKGYLHMLASTFLLAIVLATAGRRTFLGRFMLAFWIGLFVAIWAEMSDVIWFYYPIRYACLKQTYHVTSMIIMGGILAFFIRPPADAELD